jgi:hypothetical protein
VVLSRGIDRREHSAHSNPYRAREMAAVVVSALFNSAGVDDPKCCEPGESPRVHAKLKITPRESGSADVGVLINSY